MRNLRRKRAHYTKNPLSPILDPPLGRIHHQVKYQRLNVNTCIVAAILFSGHPYIGRHYRLIKPKQSTESHAPGDPGHLCSKQAHCAGAVQSPEPGQGARRSTDYTDCTSHCRCGHPVVPPVPLAVCEAQPVHLAPQYKTRYPFYRWVGWWYYIVG